MLAVGIAALWLVWSPPLEPNKESNTKAVVLPSQAKSERSRGLIQPTAASPSVRKFRAMSVEETAPFVQELQKDDLPTLFQKFLDAGRIDEDPQKQSMVNTVFGVVLKERGATPEFTERMRKFVSDESNSALERGLIVNAYASTGTKIGAEFVLWVAETHPNQELRDGARDRIAYLHGGEDRGLLCPLIEPLWRDSNDPKMLRAVAFGMARQGAPSGIQLLLLAASAPNYQDEVRRVAAVEALAVTIDKIAVPPLEAALNAEPLGSRMHTMAFRTLNQIDDSSAAEALISWIQTADSSAADLAKKWVINARAETHVAAAEAALSPNVAFRAEQNREALRKGLKVYLATHPE